MSNFVTKMKLFLLAGILSAFFCNAKSVAVVCYYGSWGAYNDTPPEKLNANLCTHINYAFIGLWEDGNLRAEDDNLDIDQGLYFRVTGLKAKNPDLKVLLSVGGGDGTSPEIFKSVFADPSKRAAFVESATYFLSEYNFDGLDVDWEYPENADKDNYIAILRELKEAFAPKGWLLTAAVCSDPEHGYNIGDMVKYLDFINLMTYDFYGPWSYYNGQNSALYSSSIESDWEKQHLNLAAAANNWVNAGFPKSKLALGTAFYGRTFTLSDPNNYGLHAGINGAGSDGGSAVYSKICTEYSNWTRVWDDEQNNPYKYSGNQWVGYEDEDSIWAKAAWIKQNGFFGVMIWTIDQDDINGECGETQHLLKQINNALAASSDPTD